MPRTRKDEEIERTLRVYSKSSTYEYVPRTKKAEEYVVARPVKVPRCVACGKTEPEPFECEFCHEYYCEGHLPPEKHECPGRKEEAMSREEEAAIKRAIAARLGDIIGRLPEVYMLIDSANAEELAAILQSLEALESVLTGIADREGEE